MFLWLQNILTAAVDREGHVPHGRELLQGSFYLRADGLDLAGTSYPLLQFFGEVEGGRTILDGQALYLYFWTYAGAVALLLFLGGRPLEQGLQRPPSYRRSILYFAGHWENFGAGDLRVQI